MPDSRSRPLGIVKKTVPLVQLRKDRPASIVYDDVMGTVPGTHYHKTCSNRSCGLTQFYGYTTTGKSSDVLYDADWELLPILSHLVKVSFQLRRFDSEIVISQMSCKQCAEAYNYYHTTSNLSKGDTCHSSQCVVYKNT